MLIHGFGTIMEKAAIVLIAAGRFIYPGDIFHRDKNHMIVILRMGKIRESVFL